MDSMKSKFKRADFLFFDNIDQLKNRPFSQEQFGFILHERLLNQLCTVVTAKQSPQRWELSPFVRSRLSAGSVIRLKQPTKVTRSQLYKRLALDIGVEISDDAANILSSSVRGTVLQMKKTLLEMSEQSQTDEIIST